MLLTLSCKRKTVEDKYPDFYGSWKHYISSDTYERIIFGDKWVTINQFRGTEDIADLGTLKHTTIKNDGIYIGRLSVKPDRKITHYPSISTYSFITENDTVNINMWYMTLDNKTYVKLK